MSEYNLHTIREMLGEAFSSGEITTLAFDLFQDIYQDFAAGMTRSQKIEMVVAAAQSRGRIPDLLSYVQRHNGYQYGRYADQLISDVPEVIVDSVPDTVPDLPLTTQNKQGPMKILFVSSDPTDEARLRLGKESSEIEDQILRGENRQNLEFDQRHAVKVDDFTFSLVRYRPDIVHFSGHGSAEGGIIFEDESGKAYEVPADAIGYVFQNFPKRIGCVLLNACFSRVQAEAISPHVDYVIGMKQEISDNAAIAFALGFYQMLAGGSSIEEAYRWGCVQIRLKVQGFDEHLTPELIVHK